MVVVVVAAGIRWTPISKWQEELSNNWNSEPLKRAFPLTHFNSWRLTRIEYELVRFGSVRFDYMLWGHWGKGKRNKTNNNCCRKLIGLRCVIIFNLAIIFCQWTKDSCIIYEHCNAKLLHPWMRVRWISRKFSWVIIISCTGSILNNRAT